MARLNTVKNDWDANVHTQAQQETCNVFKNAILNCAGQAAVHFGAADFSHAGAHGAKAQERFEAMTEKFHRFFRASTGYTIEKTVYVYLVAGLDAKGIEENVFKTSTGTIFAFEYTEELSGVLPCTFKSSRPDIRVALGNCQNGQPYEALFDLTSEGQKDHVLKKGDNWIAKKYIPHISEILWTNDDIMHK